MIANLVTSCRILFGLIMLCFPALSTGFYACYFLAGLSDMVDGTIARKLGTDSALGEKLDTVADLVFVAAALCKLLPALTLGIMIWIWVGLIALVKVSSIIVGYVVQKQLITVHSWANRMTGLVLFVLPFMTYVMEIKYAAIVACMFATFAALQEKYQIHHLTL